MAKVEHWSGIGAAMGALNAQYRIALSKARDNGNLELAEALENCWYKILGEDAMALKAICDLQD